MQLTLKGRLSSCMKIFSTPRMLVSTCQDSTYATDISWCSTTSHIRFVGRRKEREKRWGGERGRKEEKKKREKGEGERGEIGKRKKRRDKEGEQREGRGREREKRGREKCVWTEWWSKSNSENARSLAHAEIKSYFWCPISRWHNPMWWLP